MQNYVKGKNVEEELTKEAIPIDNLPNDFLWMQVKGGTKVTNVIDFAKQAVDNGEHRHIVWTGSGGGVGKTISCAEIMKRQYPMHQLTQLCYRKVEEFWEPLVDGLEEIVATRQIPCIHILLSLDEIDAKTSSYQFSNKKTSFWVEPEPKKPKTSRYNAYENKSKYQNAGGAGGMNGGASGSGSGNNRNNNSKRKKKPPKSEAGTESTEKVSAKPVET